MKLTIPRLTVRLLMAAVAIVALLFSGEITRERAAEYRNRAAAHEEMELRLRRGLMDYPTAKALEGAGHDLMDTVEPSGRSEHLKANLHAHAEGKLKELATAWEEDDREDRLWIEWHARMKEKYRQAMWRPWKPASLEASPGGPLSSEAERQLYGTK